MKKRILFVDDDPQLLTSIKRMLWSAQDRWELSFAASGDEALALLDAAPHDVLVADIRMPGMDGRQLLRQARKRYPWMMRLVLSGDSNRERILRTVPVSHQFLTKPVSAATLMGVIARGCALRDMILADDLKRIIGRIDSLPALPGSYASLLRILEDESASVEAIAAVIDKDVGLTADVLKLVNSSFFGPRTKVRDICQALTLLGLETVKGLTLSAKVLRMFDTKKLPGFSFPGLWEHSLNTARMARRIALAEGLAPDAQDDSFIAGMLHDLGKFVLADRFTGGYRTVVDCSKDENLSLYASERRILGADHAQAGAYLLGLWGLSDSVLEAVAFHHEPSALGLTAMSPVTAVHAANVLEHRLVVVNPGYARPAPDAEHFKRTGLTARLDAWERICKEALESGGEGP